MCDRWIMVVRSLDNVAIAINIAQAVAMVPREHAGEPFKDKLGETVIIFPGQPALVVEQDLHTLMKGSN